ncbi:unnamed protein product [Cylindrotheca closterium]|uniref:Uncharacterized protein n=1 Tax=Cylindrotheca closterium TaxID=2856 RepID=A0AAD2CJ97_9STRA|nr:unnamed protein product [Cylindrotheca closterium]
MESRILATDTGQEGKAAIPEKPYFNMYFYQNTSSRPAPTSTSTSKASARPFLCINQNTIQGLRVHPCHYGIIISMLLLGKMRGLPNGQK